MTSSLAITRLPWPICLPLSGSTQPIIRHSTTGPTVYIHLEDWESALADLDSALEIAEFAAAYFNRGYVYLKQGENEQAVEEFTYAIALYPLYASAYYERGAAYQELRDHEAAVSDYLTALNLGYDDPGVIRDHAIIMIAYGKDARESLLILYDYLAELNPSDADTYYHRGSIHDLQGNTQEAIADYQRFLELQVEPDQNTGTAQERLEALGAGD
jgi:tetratricopeptide (TPR) repeat protein